MITDINTIDIKLPIQEFPEFELGIEDRLQLAFLEIGIKPIKKRSQLRHKKQLILKYWGDKYKKELGVDNYPETYKILAHYDPKKRVSLDRKKYEIDLLLQYYIITPEMLLQLTEDDIEELLIVAHKEHVKNDITTFLSNLDTKAITDLLTTNQNPSFSHLKGKLAEILVFRDIRNNLPKNSYFLTNGEIEYFNNIYKNGTEIDGILLFNSKDSYERLIEKLRYVPHLAVYQR